MVKRMRSFFAVIMLVIAATINAQVTTSSMTGKVVDSSNEAIIGATIQVMHEPSGSRYGAITNVDGRYSIQGMRAGGPYKVEVSYVGYQTAVFKNINLQLGENYVLDATLKESTELLDEVVVVASANSNMKSNRSGAMTNVNAQQMAVIPSVSRSMSDIMRLSPQGSSTTNGFAVGGGNYRQSNVTIDGAQFNNTFGLGTGNMPGGGNPISLDALEQVSVSITPYDVRQSGFNGGAINAVTRSGTNEFRGSAYTYITNNNFIGDKVGGDDINVEDSHKYTYGASIGGPIIKNKLFFFVNGEYEDNMAAGPTAKAGGGVDGTYLNNNRRPTLNQLNGLTDYMSSTFGFNTGAWEGYNLSIPSYRILARLDWNIDENNKFNIRFTKSNKKTNSGATTSRSPLVVNSIYGGSNGTYGSGSYYGMSSKSTRYYSEYRFTSIAGELNSRFGKFTNTLRGTYSFQDQPRSTDFGNLPTVEILMSDGQGHYPTWALIGSDPFTMGNLSQTKNIVLTDELNATIGKHNLFAGFQYEYNHAVNGYAQMGAGYYAYEATAEQVNNGDWASVFAASPRVFAITYGNNAAHSMFQAEMSTHQYSLYLQDNIDFTENFKLSLGARFELPSYPALKDNFNQGFWDLRFGRSHYATDQVPDNTISISPRVGFNWDLSNGERKYVLRGGTGIFVGRMPFVWLISAVGNSGMGQTTYTYYKQASGGSGTIAPSFTTSQASMLEQIKATNSTEVPQSPTILSADLQMPKTWKASLAFDAKLPGDIDFTLEGIYNKDLNPCVVSNKNTYWDGSSAIELSNYDTRNYMSNYYSGNQAFVIENAGKKAYYWSINAQLRKIFDFGLALSASYTHSQAKSYTEGIGDQVSSAYVNYRNSINAVNDNETGYSTYVAPNRILLSASYKLKEGKNAASTFSLIYDGSENGFMGNYSYTRYSYIFSSNVTNDMRAPGNLLYIPRTREELDSWNFVANGTYTDASGNKQAYTADMQRDDFWTYINQDSYLKKRKGQYTERGGAKMPWHHQLDFKFNQDFYLMVGGKRHTLQLGCDITNLPNLLNNDWGLYKQLSSNTLLSYKPGTGTNGSNGTFTYNLANNARHLKTYQNYVNTWSTYQVLFSVRYIFN